MDKKDYCGEEWGSGGGGCFERSVPKDHLKTNQFARFFSPSLWMGLNWI
jgi:hypothetical protein